MGASTLYYNMTDKNMFNATPALFFDFENPQMDPDVLEKEITETIEKLNVIGLSANQIGHDVRCMALNSQDRGVVVMFNPQLKAVSKETVVMREGDAMVPDFYVNLKRPKHIVLEYQDSVGDTHELDLSDVAARCVLHELDNLNGVLFFARASRLKLQRAIKSKLKREKRRYE